MEGIRICGFDLATYLESLLAPSFQPPLRHKASFVVFVLPMGVEALLSLYDAKNGDQCRRLLPHRIDASLQDQEQLHRKWGWVLSNGKAFAMIRIWDLGQFKLTTMRSKTYLLSELVTQFVHFIEVMLQSVPVGRALLRKAMKFEHQLIARILQVHQRFVGHQKFSCWHKDQQRRIDESCHRSSETIAGMMTINVVT